MKKVLKNNLNKKNQFLIDAAKSNVDKVLNNVNSTVNGLSNEQVDINRDNYGNNVVVSKKKKSVFKRILESYVNPFTAILFALAIVSLFTDVIFADPEEKSFVTIIIILTMVFISGTLKFVQDTRSSNSAEKLANMIHTTTLIKREGVEKLWGGWYVKGNH